MKILKSIKESGLLIKNASKIIENKEEKKRKFIGLLLGKLGVSLLENLLVDKFITLAGEGTVRAWVAEMSWRQGHDF